MAKTEQTGLYDATNEHDACGVGMVVNIHGNKSHELVDSALKVLENMRHRGAEGADNKTGDGAGCGIMIGYICSAVTDIVVTFAQDSNIVNLHNWWMGSVSGMTWANVGAAACVVLPALAAAFLLSKPMAAYQMGESYARSVGVPVRAFSTALVLLSSLLSACVTAFAGPISFVGIAVPHLVKNLLGSAKPLYVLPGCCLGGAAFCLLCDLIARSLFAPTELSISSVTAVFGAPVVIWLLVRRQTQEGRE